jgi:hypothetical protein
VVASNESTNITAILFISIEGRAAAISERACFKYIESEKRFIPGSIGVCPHDLVKRCAFGGRAAKLANARLEFFGRKVLA